MDAVGVAQLAEHRTVARTLWVRFTSPTPQSKAFTNSQITRKSAKSQFADFLICFPHVSRGRIAIDIHRGTDVRVPHQLLLHSHRRTDRIQPRAIAVTETMQTDVLQPYLLCSL